MPGRIDDCRFRRLRRHSGYRIALSHGAMFFSRSSTAAVLPRCVMAIIGEPASHIPVSRGQRVLRGGVSRNGKPAGRQAARWAAGWAGAGCRGAP